MSLAARLDGVKAWVGRVRLRFAPQIDWLMGTIPGRCLRLFLRIEGRDRILALAGQAFIALVPLLIVVATVTSSVDGAAIGDYLVRRFDLTGSTAAAVQTLFERPPGATGGFTLLSLAVLLWSMRSFAKSLQRTFESAWQLQDRPGRRPVDGVLGTIVLVAVVVGLAYLGHGMSGLTLGPVAAALLQLLLLVPSWALVSYLLLSRRRRPRSLLPGAVISSVAQLLLGWVTALYVPGLIERQAERYGVIGVAFALVSWLVLVAGVIVASAVVGAEVGSQIGREARVQESL